MITLRDLAGIAITFVVVAITLAVGADILTTIQAPYASLGNASTAWNASYNGLLSVQTLASWLPTIAIIIAAAVVIGVIAAYFYMN